MPSSFPFASPFSPYHPIALVLLNSFSIFPPTYPPLAESRSSNPPSDRPSPTAPFTIPLPPSYPSSPRSSVFSSLLSLDISAEDLLSEAASRPSRLGNENMDGHVDARALEVEDRKMMADLMALKATKSACEMAAEVVGLILPALPKGSGHDSLARSIAAKSQKTAVANTLSLWMNIPPSPLITLIVTIILLERLHERHPNMGNEIISTDAPLRVAFAWFLLALKFVSDGCFHNRSLCIYTPWKLSDINAMEKQLLQCLGWDLWVSSQEVLHRAAGFWKDAQTLSSSPSPTASDESASDAPILPGIGNLFLMQRRTDVTERGWRGGLVMGAGKSGSRIPPEGSEGEAGRVE